MVHWKDKIWEVNWGITFFGSRVFFLITLLFLWVLDNPLLLPFSIAFIFGEVVCNSIKAIWFKERPNKQKYKTLLEKIDAGSWPSVHSYRAAVLCLGYILLFKQAALQFFIVFFAIGIGYSRIYLKKHDIRDVSGGAIIGLVVGYVLFFVV